ncbi:hypothetical protein CTI12_AA460270 [Artemisia annua]|uniref:Uncharacterized protein n=1 Tax=Artemisia annua TaxID=35608 RepID=A0A2U1LRZ3_ARTAN|nr:hypothetical protein CTI12_AA460270 [Artemisia annua]
MGENKLLLLKFTFHVGGKFMELPFRYEGGKVEVRESYEFFASWVDFVEFIRGFHFENVNKVYQQITLGRVDGYDDLRHIYDEKTAEAAMERLTGICFSLNLMVDSVMYVRIVEQIVLHFIGLLRNIELVIEFADMG